jgi:hypothetical protein
VAVFEAEEDPGAEAHRDEAATEPPADSPEDSPSERQGDSEESGGPLGNPAVDEESLRKQQEESSERSD